MSTAGRILNAIFGHPVVTNNNPDVSTRPPVPATVAPAPKPVPAPKPGSNQPREINAAALNLIKGFESFVPFVYDDMAPSRLPWKDGRRYGYLPWDGGPVKGTLTIGYGHTDAAHHPLKCTLGTEINEAGACRILDVDLTECRATVQDLVKVPVTGNQFGALGSFQFNTGALGKSSALVALNEGRFDDVPSLLGLYNRVHGQVLEGLNNRRKAEIALFKTPGEIAV